MPFELLVVSCLPALLSAQGSGHPLQNRRDEPAARAFSLERAYRHAASAAKAWRERHSCVTCHTNGMFLLAGAVVDPEGAAHRENQAFARKYLARYVVEGKQPSGQRGSITGLVATTMLVTLSEARSGKLHDVTRRALDHVLGELSPQGHWPGWLKCAWPPYESDDHFGVVLALLAVSQAPPDYRRSRNARAAVKRMRAWIAKNPPANAHHKGMLLWAGRHDSGVLDTSQRTKWRKELLALQEKDGGWVMAELGDSSWKRADGSPQSTLSDAYATAFAVYALRQAGVAATDPAIERGVAWLESRQRASGRWHARSPKRDTKHYISQAATNFALLALASCGRTLSRPAK